MMSKAGIQPLQHGHYARLTLFKWFGGKRTLAKNILPFVPEGGHPYCEPYCGAASLFFLRQPAITEVLNDRDGNIINLFRCLQDRTKFEELKHRLTYTPYARDELERAINVLDDESSDDISRAWAFFVKMNQIMSGVPTKANKSNWSITFRSAQNAAKTFSNRVKLLDFFADRLLNVYIENGDAIDVIKRFDNEHAVFYIDPPYVLSTRKNRNVYSHEVDIEHHKSLVDMLLNCSGAVTLSCYFHDVYQPLVDAGWYRKDFDTICYAAGRIRNSKLVGEGSSTKHVPRVETLLINPKAL